MNDTRVTIVKNPLIMITQNESGEIGTTIVGL